MLIHLVVKVFWLLQPITIRTFTFTMLLNIMSTAGKTAQRPGARLPDKGDLLAALDGEGQPVDNLRRPGWFFQSLRASGLFRTNHPSAGCETLFPGRCHVLRCISISH